jgi:gas vesicle protein
MNEFLKNLVPMIGTALGGPLGGAAASFIADKLGLDTKDVKAVSEVLNSGKMTPDQITQLKLAEIDFSKFLEANKIKLEEIAALDRGSAREMLKSTKSHVPAVLTYLLTAGFFGVLGLMFYLPELKESAPVMIMLGSLGTAWTSACAFWFGTTSGSKDKTDLLMNSTPVK